MNIHATAGVVVLAALYKLMEKVTRYALCQKTLDVRMKHGSRLQILDYSEAVCVFIRDGETNQSLRTGEWIERSSVHSKVSGSVKDGR